MKTTVAVDSASFILRAVFGIMIVFLRPSVGPAAWWEVHWRELETAYKENNSTKVQGFIQEWEKASTAVREKRRLRQPSNVDSKVESLSLSIASRREGTEKTTWLVQPDLEVIVVDNLDKLRFEDTLPAAVLQDLDKVNSRFTLNSFSVRVESAGVRILLFDPMRTTAIQRFVTGVSDLASLDEPPTTNAEYSKDEKRLRLQFLGPDLRAEITADGKRLRFLSPCEIRIICFDKEFREAVVLVTYQSIGKLVAIRSKETNGRWEHRDSALLNGVLLDSFVK